MVSFQQGSSLLKKIKKIIICYLVIKSLASLFVVFFFIVELSRSHIPNNRLVKLIMVALDFFSRFFLWNLFFFHTIYTLVLNYWPWVMYFFIFFLDYSRCVLIKLTRVSFHFITQYFLLASIFFARSFFYKSNFFYLDLMSWVAS
jgi:hypothetical protein